MADMKTCTEKTRRWPDALADVPSDEMDDFLTHAEACPYHTEILRAEDAELRAAFRQARGLDSQGRLLLGDELQAAIAEHERRLKIWQETLKTESTFSDISLYNGGRKIASCGKFFDLAKHESLHELDPQAGLQIRGIRGGDLEEDVLLGFYALVGVRHNDDEQFLQLDNGYTVGLKVRPSEERTFMVQFRCVETSALEQERADASTTPKTIARSGSAHGSSFSPLNSQEHASTNPVLPGASGWFPPPTTNWRAGTLCALVLLSIVVVACNSKFESLQQPKGIGDFLRVSVEREGKNVKVTTIISRNGNEITNAHVLPSGQDASTHGDDAEMEKVFANISTLINQARQIQNAPVGERSEAFRDVPSTPQAQELRDPSAQAASH
jgi:hypothetical protein